MHRFIAALLGLVVTAGIVNIGDDLTDELGNITPRARMLGALADIPDFDDSEYRRVRRAYQYNAVAADSINVNRLTVDSLIVGEFFSPPSVSTLPTCNADTEPAILFDSSDNLLKGCSDLSGSFEWNPIGGDVDGDGFAGSGRRPIDADDNDNTVFARNLIAANVKSGTEIGPSGDVILTGTLVYRTETTYTGNDARVAVQGNQRFLYANPNNDQLTAAVFFACIQNGHVAVESWTTATATNDHRALLSGSINSAHFGEWLDDPGTATSDLWTTLFRTGYLSGFTCYDFSS